MEKLTEKLRYVLEDCIDCISPIQQEVINKAVDRLAAYEKTGMDPEDLKLALNEDAVLKLAGQVLSVTPDRLRELAKADKEGQHIPAADVAEVRHGKFNFLQEDMVWCYCGVCSVCRNYVQAWNYCPNCGARMDEEAEQNAD